MARLPVLRLLFNRAKNSSAMLSSSNRRVPANTPAPGCRKCPQRSRSPLFAIRTVGENDVGAFAARFQPDAFMLLSPASFSSCFPVRVEPERQWHRYRYGAKAPARLHDQTRHHVQHTIRQPRFFRQPRERIALSGDFSDGFRITLFPAAAPGRVSSKSAAAGSSTARWGNHADRFTHDHRQLMATGGRTSPYTLSIASAYQRMARAAREYHHAGCDESVYRCRAFPARQFFSVGFH